MHSPADFPEQHLHLSQLLRDLAISHGENGLTIGAIVDRLRDRGPAAVLALLALTIALPMPMPGISAIFGLPMLLISLQLMTRNQRFWLPRSVRNRPVDVNRLAPILNKAAQRLEGFEIMLRPRWRLMTHPLVQTFYGGVCAWLSLILFLPVPFGNTLPSLAIFALGLALLERDGIVAVIGLLLSTVAIIVTLGSMAAIIYGGAAVWNGAAGV